MKHLSLFFYLCQVYYYPNNNAQCNTWINSPTQNEAENAHSIYRQAMKVNDFLILLLSTGTLHINWLRQLMEKGFSLY